MRTCWLPSAQIASTQTELRTRWSFLITVQGRVRALIHGGDFVVQDVWISLVEIDALLDHGLSCSRLSSRHDVGRSNSILAPIEYFKSGGACPFLAGIRQPSALREESSLPIATWWLSSEQSFSNYVGLSSRRNFL